SSGVGKELNHASWFLSNDAGRVNDNQRRAGTRSKSPCRRLVEDRTIAARVTIELTPGTIRPGDLAMRIRRLLLVIVTLWIGADAASADQDEQTPIRPGKAIALFNGKDLTGLYTWLKETKKDDPGKVFSVEEGVLHISGDGYGYVATETAYRDYHVIVEYKWGKRTDGGKYVRNSGILLHATGPDGGAGGTWMSSIECQLAQGCVGDLIVIRGEDAEKKLIPVALTSDVVLGPDKRPRWKQG